MTSNFDMFNIVYLCCMISALVCFHEMFYLIFYYSVCLWATSPFDHPGLDIFIKYASWHIFGAFTFSSVLNDQS